jgi:hypothetical protein
LRLTRFFSLILFFCIAGSAYAYQDISFGVLGGYAGNLFADSFNIGNSYLVNNVSLSSVNFQKVKLRVSYDFYYTNYDTDNPINNVFHIPGISIYQKNRNSRLRWGISSYLSFKDYINSESSFDSRRFYGLADVSYYLSRGLQLKGSYKFNRFQYANYSSLDIMEHGLESELVATLPTKTTVRGTLRYGVRRFDEDKITFHWYDTEAGISQSLDQKTGVNLSFSCRWSSGGTRPLSTYNIISGITSFWDPWKGNQIDFSIKRILPLAIVSKIDAEYWNRKFTYDPVIRNQFWWLRYSSGRWDEGWLTKADLSHQFNRFFLIKKTVRLAFIGGYSSNNSDDSYYGYDGLFAQARLEIRLF